MPRRAALADFTAETRTRANNEISAKIEEIGELFFIVTPKSVAAKEKSPKHISRIRTAVNTTGKPGRNRHDNGAFKRNRPAPLFEGSWNFGWWHSCLGMLK
jgi:hypothetical protein